jgi:DNA-directed RNA polymerase specialized sigma24 family protein
MSAVGALAEAYVRQRQALKAFLIRRTRDPAAGEDLLQDLWPAQVERHRRPGRQADIPAQCRPRLWLPPRAEPEVDRRQRILQSFDLGAD